MDRNNECCNPGTRAIIKCLYTIDENLVGPAIDMLYNVKVDLENTMENINVGEQFSVPKEEDYEDLYDKRSILRNICIHAAVMLEIGAMYLIHMARGRDAPFYKLELFSGENQLLREIEDWECKTCGNALLIEDDNMSVDML